MISYKSTVLWMMFLLVSAAAAPTARAESCMQRVKDAALCGQDCTAQTAKKCVKFIEACGTETYKCGTEKITDGARCGYDTFTTVAVCGAQCIGSGFTKCSCKKARSCNIDKYCTRDKQCERERCEAANACTPRECNVVRASCSIIPQDWKNQILANITANNWLRQQILAGQAQVAQGAAQAAAFPSTHGARLLGGLRDIAAREKSKREAWQSRFNQLLKDQAKLDVLIQALLKVSRGQIDGELKGHVKKLDGWLVGDGKTRWAQASTFDAVIRYAQEALSVRSAHAAYGDELAFSVAVNINGGTIFGGYLSIGVAWDRQGVVKGVLMPGIMVGAVLDAGGDLTYRVHPGNMAVVAGQGMGIAGSAAYGVGGNACIEWSAPYTNPVPTWGYGVSVGAPGGQVSWVYGGTVVFPKDGEAAPAAQGAPFISKNGKCLDVNGADFDSKVNGGRVQAWDCHGGGNQKWRLDGERLISSNGKCLDVNGADFDAKVNGGRVQLWDCHGGDNQKWRVDNGRLRSANGKCLDLAGADFDAKVNGGKIQLWECHNAGPEQWRFGP